MQLFNVVDIIWRFLVNVIVNPIGIEQIGVSTPGNDRRIVGIVIPIIVLRQIHIITNIPVALIFIIKRVGRILQMTRDKELTAIPRHHHADPTIG